MSVDGNSLCKTVLIGPGTQGLLLQILLDHPVTTQQEVSSPIPLSNLTDIYYPWKKSSVVKCFLVLQVAPTCTWKVMEWSMATRPVWWAQHALSQAPTVCASGTTYTVQPLPWHSMSTSWLKTGPPKSGPSPTIKAILGRRRSWRLKLRSLLRWESAQKKQIETSDNLMLYCRYAIAL